MALEFKLGFTSRVEVLPKATLGDGTEVTDYATKTIMEVKGVSGDYTSRVCNWISFAPPTDKTADDFVSWSTFSSSKPDCLQSMMDSYSGTVTASVVNSIESQFNAPLNESATAWAETE